MARQQETIGAVVEINLKNGFFAYAQILDGGYAFFDYQVEIPLENLEKLAGAKVIFIVAMYNYIVTQGHWKKIGKLPIRPALEELPLKFIQDALDPSIFELYDPNTGEIRPATKEECIGLERAMVWEKDGIEQRLRDYFDGIPNETVSYYKIQ